MRAIVHAVLTLKEPCPFEGSEHLHAEWRPMRIQDENGIRVLGHHWEGKIPWDRPWHIVYTPADGG